MLASLEPELREQGLTEKMDMPINKAKFYTAHPQTNMGRIVDLLNQRGISFRTVNVVDLTIEDVFIYFTGEKFPKE